MPKALEQNILISADKKQNIIDEGNSYQITVGNYVVSWFIHIQVYYIPVYRGVSSRHHSDYKRRIES